jgi:hypothetical protein
MGLISSLLAKADIGQAAGISAASWPDVKEFGDRWNLLLVRTL